MSANENNNTIKDFNENINLLTVNMMSLSSSAKTQITVQEAVINNTKILGLALETIAEVLIELFTQLQTGILTFVNTLKTMPNSIISAIKNMGKAMGVVVYQFGLDTAVDSLKQLNAVTKGLSGLGSGSSSKQKPGGFLGTGKRFDNILTHPIEGLKSIYGSFKKSFGEMVPQMAMLAIVTEPVMAFLQGVLEPLSALSEIFGAFGQILGTMFLPVMNALTPILLQLLPPFQQLATAVGPMLLQLMTPLMAIINVGVSLLVMILPIISTLINIITPFTGILTYIATPLNILAGLFQKLGDMFNNVMAGAEKFTGVLDKIQGYFNTLSGQGISDFFSGEGRYGKWWQGGAAHNTGKIG